MNTKNTAGEQTPISISWQQASRVIAAALENGTSEGRRLAKEQLARMAQVADAVASGHRATLVSALREAGHVVVVWSPQDVPGHVDDPAGWLEEHGKSLEDACVAAGQEVIDQLAEASASLKLC